MTGHRRAGRGGALRAVVAGGIAIAAALVLLPTFRGPGSQGPADTAQAAVIHRICPVADCAGYPVPAGVRGITIAALSNWVLYSHAMKAQIAAMPAWHANTVRFQIPQDRLVGADGKHYSPQYMAIIRSETNYALRHHLYVVLNAQTETSLGYVRNEPLPTAATWSFWRHIAQVYGHNKRVMFDLFNEPRKYGWGRWRAAFQPLVTYIRQIGAINQIWVEGLRWASTLQGVPLLSGQGIVYSYHHPGSPWSWQSPIGPVTWDRAFGDLAARGVPVVDGEFVNYLGGYYWPRSTQMVSRYFEYLKYHHIGLVSWTLQAGIMTAGANYAVPIKEPQGAGRLIMRYYASGSLAVHDWHRTEHISRRVSRRYRRRKYEKNASHHA